MRLGTWGALVVATLAASCGDDPNSTTSSTSSSSGSSGSSGSSSSGASGSSSSGSSSSSGGGGTAAEICVSTMNDFRAAQGLPPYERWSAIESCSDSEAQSDGTTGTAHGAFPKCGESSQNECPGWPGPADQMIKKCLQAMWQQPASEPHRANMASTKWKRVACGFYTLPSGAVWSVQNFQ
jgi:uncharacterized protein YkwD